MDGVIYASRAAQAKATLERIKSEEAEKERQKAELQKQACSNAESARSNIRMNESAIAQLRS
jgi:hypothetical protein